MEYDVFFSISKTPVNGWLPLEAVDALPTPIAVEFKAIAHLGPEQP
jgi:hypothetical protein